jgi:transcriptional regulator with XRE-family HTH domain
MIEQRRAALGLSQRALATRVGLSDVYTTQLETQERINHSLLSRTNWRRCSRSRWERYCNDETGRGSV